MIHRRFHNNRLGQTPIFVVAFSSILAYPALPTYGQPSANANPVPADASVPELFTDFLHYARLGRFTMADSFAEALLEHPDLDSVVVLEVADRDRRSVETLEILIENSTIGENAKKILDLLEQGEFAQRKESERIYDNIEKLAGSPRQEWVAMRNLAQSGEYAVPALVHTLLDASKTELHRRVINALIAVGKPAVNPLVAALDVDSLDVRVSLIRVLGEIGYSQAIPYLRRLATQPDAQSIVQDAVAAAIGQIERISGRPSGAGSAHDGFYLLAGRYFSEDAAVRADPRVATANVWDWDDELQAVVATEIPQPIFAPVMAMRCAQHALELTPDHDGAIALWLASNIRREARLGYDVESGDPNETATPDATRPDEFPRALYFTQAAGPKYAHMVLEHALDTGDAAVALGAIEALRVTAGPATLVGRDDHRLALSRALKFPDRVVRIRTALALGAALPRSGFTGSDLVIPTIAEALTLNGKDQIVVIDHDERELNRLMDSLRSDARYVIGDTNSNVALGRVRSELEHLNGAVIATDIRDPGLGVTLAQLRSEESFANVPVVVVAKDSHATLARTVATADPFAETVDAMAGDEALEAALRRARDRAGQTQIDAALAVEIALEAADTLLSIAANGRSVYKIGRAEQALLAALASSNKLLQSKTAAVLAHLSTSSAQSGIARLGLDVATEASLRVEALAALAASGKRNGSMLDGSNVERLVDVALNDPDLTIREAASRAMGALDLSAGRPADIIRNFQRS